MTTNEKIIVHSELCECLAWKPIFAGALVAIGLTFLLNLFSVAIGLTAYTTDSSGAETFMLGGLLGTCIGIVASMFGAGWITGYLGRRYCKKRHMGALYGILTWCVALVAGILLFRYVQDYVVFYSHFISGTMSSLPGSSGSVAAAASDVSADKVVMSSYIVFSLFFLSAFASGLGGHCGMRHVCENEG